MNIKYRKTITTVSLINYHFVFCPRYRTKIFDNLKVEKRFKKLMSKISSNLDLKILLLSVIVTTLIFFLRYRQS